ncbi:MAG: glutathione S-transferase family protein [Granulosicoccus sp.]|nr:glutathione S-transferase family protein [Granulosicoccus sp.]
MSITFYSAVGSVGLAAHVVLEELKESSSFDYELILLDMSNTEHRGDEYKKINPKARVPSLIVDGTVLTETPAILAFLAQTNPDSSLRLPTDPMAFAQIQSFNSYLCSTVHVAHAHKYRGSRWTDDKAALAALTANVPNTMAACFEDLETHFFTGPWVMGAEFTICDPYLLAISSWLESDGVDIERFPKLKKHREAMHKRSAVQSVFRALQNS